MMDSDDGLAGAREWVPFTAIAFVVLVVLIGGSTWLTLSLVATH
jgi:hypothetical protein